MARQPTGHPELAAEQAYIDKIEAAHQRSRDRAQSAAESGGDRYAARSIRQHMLQRLGEPVDVDSLCFGKIDFENGRHYYLGRGAVHDEESKLLVINWRRPLAAPFYEAHRADPQGLRLRRRFQLDQLRLLGIVDDVFGAAVPVAEEQPAEYRPAPAKRVEAHPTSAPAPEAVPEAAEPTPPEASAPSAPTPKPAIDPQLQDAILADMNRARGEGMRDIVATIEASQYALIKDSIEGILAIQGGPGTGKTAIALHRAAYLLYNHRELEQSGVLVVGPNRTFMEYVAAVLPTLGEASVVQLPVDRLTDLEDVRVRGADAPEVARLKGNIGMARVVQAAVSQRVRIPTEDIEFTVDRIDIILPVNRIMELVTRARREAATYVSARDAFRRLLIALARERTPQGRGVFRTRVSAAEVEAAVTAPGGPLDRVWPTITSPEVIRDLFNSRRRLAAAGEGPLNEEERDLLRRDRQRLLRDEPWTHADIPLLDEAEVAIRGITSSYGYVLADEAQDFSAMQLRMVLRRSSTGRATLVGDMAQATAPGHFNDWDDLLRGVDLFDRSRVAELAIGHRVPSQIADLAATLVPRIAPDLIVPTAVRMGPEDPRIVQIDEAVLGDELVRHVRSRVEGERMIGVITRSSEFDAVHAVLVQAGLDVGDVLKDGLSKPITVLTPAQAKGLEFDHVIVVDPALMAGEGEEWAYVYIALTRATRTLTVLYTTPKPFELPPIPVIEPDADELVLREEAAEPDSSAGTILGPRYSEALMQAKFLHAGQQRRGTRVPYLAHLQSVAAMVLEDGGSEDEAIAALLHDSAEDLGSDLLERIVDQFGVHVARIVAGCTDPEAHDEISWRERKSEHLRSLESAGPKVRRVALAEKLDNARALLRDYRQLGARVWERMDVEEADILWYQEALADLFVTESPGDLAEELRTTVNTLLDLASDPDPQGMADLVGSGADE